MGGQPKIIFDKNLGHMAYTYHATQFKKKEVHKKKRRKKRRKTKHLFAVQGYGCASRSLDLVSLEEANSLDGFIIPAEFRQQ